MEGINQLKFKQMASIAVAIIALPFCRSLMRRKIVLVGGHEGDHVADNSKVLYEFLAGNQQDYEIFWVINDDSVDRQNVYNPISRGGVKNFLYFMAADGVFYSHTGSDVAPILHNFWRGTVRVHLDHGIVGLKKAKLAPGSRSSHLGPEADLWVSSSQFEKDIKVQQYGLPEDRVKITGHARYDRLLPPPVYRKEVLFMPTWREWLADGTEAEFVETDFYRDLRSVISNPRLRAALAARGYKLEVCLHFYFHKFIKTLDISGDPLVEVLPADVDVQNYLVNSEVLVTDYSSVAWDFFYLDKPVLFFQPDLATYLELRGSYVDMRSGLFGPQSFDADVLAGHVEAAIDHGQELVARYREDKERYFAFHDTENCRRTFEAFREFAAAPTKEQLRTTEARPDL